MLFLRSPTSTRANQSITVADKPAKHKQYLEYLRDRIRTAPRALGTRAWLHFAAPPSWTLPCGETAANEGNVEVANNLPKPCSKSSNSGALESEL